MECVKPASWIFLFVAVWCLGTIDTLTMSEAHAAQDECYSTFWPTSGRVVEIEACERGGGSTSGYTILRNNTSQDISVCWTLHFGNGDTSSGCNSRLRAGDARSASCYSCNRQHKGGVVNVTWTRLEAA